MLVPRVLPRRSELETETVESEIAWSLMYSDFRTHSGVGGLDESNAMLDMERMGVSIGFPSSSLVLSLTGVPGSFENQLVIR